jgi:predicted transcriptional regulator
VDTLKCDVASTLDGLIKQMVSSSLSSFSSSKLVTESAIEIQQKILSANISDNGARLLHERRQQQQPHRHTHEIIKQILQTVYSRTRKDHYCKSLDIAYGCELTWAQFRQYRDLLLGRKLLTSPDTKDFSHYKITDKGLLDICSYSARLKTF